MALVGIIRGFSISSDLFYQNLPVFNHFHGILEEDNFYPVPDDWWVFITDVEGSTQAIESGRYKDVNMLGAASIVAAQNALGELEFPYVFGGDGASFIVPPSCKEKTIEALNGICRLAKQTFSMNLRAGMVEAGELAGEGHKVSVAKFNLVQDKHLAKFRGGGLLLAEEKIKQASAEYAIPINNKDECDLTGLSCRWQPIRSKQGQMLALLVIAQDERQQIEIYGKILRFLRASLDNNYRKANPVHKDNMGYLSILKSLISEKRLHHDLFSLSFLKRAIEILFSVLIFKYKLPATFNADDYALSLSTHCDYRKFDDMLRMVLDCTPDQISKIEAFFESRFQKDEIYYGLHTSDHALMTCFVHSPVEGEHIHFIDGSDGGYAVAAKQLKAQIKASD